MNTRETIHEPFDLHLHSSCSDGSDTPTEVMRAAAARGITMLALTDHDNVSGVPEAMAEAQRIGIRLLPAIEMDAEWSHEMHILGLDIDTEEPRMKQALETALLGLMNKGVTVGQAARAAKAFSDAGILVHAYLMYGFPTQTAQETVDALEIVRQLFEAGCIQSGFFHRFACTAHSPVGRNPEKYGIERTPARAAAFARNDVGFVDRTGVDHDALGKGLVRALYNYMHGVGLDADARGWFEGRVPRARVARDFIAREIAR